MIDDVTVFVVDGIGDAALNGYDTVCFGPSRVH